MPNPADSNLKVMSFGEHLDELRSRLIRSLTVTFFFAIIALIFRNSLMDTVSGPHQRAMHQVQGTRLARDVERKLTDLRQSLVFIPLREGAAALAFEERELEIWSGFEEMVEERGQEEPLAAAIAEVLSRERELSVTGSGIRARIEEIDLELVRAHSDPPWGVAEEIESSRRQAVAMIQVLDLWRAESRDPGERGSSYSEGARADLRECFEALGTLAELSRRLANWREEPVPLQLLNYTEAFFSTLKLAFLVGLLCGLPWITFEMWTFIAAGLYQHERSVVAPFLPFSMLGLVAGGMFAYHVLIPVGLTYLGGYGDPDLFAPNFTLSHYLSLVFTLLIGMGLVFQLPLLMIMLSRSGLVSPEMFREVRKYSLLGALITAALLTPPDVVTQMLMAGPLVILYESGILASLWFRRRARGLEERQRAAASSQRSVSSVDSSLDETESLEESDHHGKGD